MPINTDPRPTDEQMLKAWGLPDPYDPTICTTHVAGDYLTEAQTILKMDKVPKDLQRGAARAVSIYLQRADVVTKVWTEAVNGPSDVKQSGWNDEGGYGWAVDSVFHDSRATPFTVVTWSDGVANDWCQIVRDQDHAEKFLRVLAHLVKHNETMTRDWEEDAPVDCTGWKVDTQIHGTVVLAADGTPERVEVPMTFDPDFITSVTGPDGTTYYVDPSFDEKGIVDGPAEEIYAAVQGGEVYVPHIDLAEEETTDIDRKRA